MRPLWVLCCLLLLAGMATAVSLNRFELAIRMFEWHDRRHPPPAGCTVFVGSSSFTKWHTLEYTFRDLPAVNRGFGGSTLPEVNHYVDRIVIPYHPRRVVVYAGTNDIAEGHNAPTVAADFRTLAEHLRQALPNAELYYISISVAPSRVQWSATYDEANRLIAGYIAKQPHFHFIDVRPVMLDAHGKLRGDLFGPDHLHMNPQGYALWVPVIRHALTP